MNDIEMMANIRRRLDEINLNEAPRIPGMGKLGGDAFKKGMETGSKGIEKFIKGNAGEVATAGEKAVGDIAKKPGTGLAVTSQPKVSAPPVSNIGTAVSNIKNKISSAGSKAGTDIATTAPKEPGTGMTVRPNTSPEATPAPSNGGRIPPFKSQTKSPGASGSWGEPVKNLGKAAVAGAAVASLTGDKDTTNTTTAQTTPKTSAKGGSTANKTIPRHGTGSKVPQKRAQSKPAGGLTPREKMELDALSVDMESGVQDPKVKAALDQYYSKYGR
jgi:hypothetical protein